MQLAKSKAPFTEVKEIDESPHNPDVETINDLCTMAKDSIGYQLALRSIYKRLKFDKDVATALLEIEAAISNPRNFSGN